MRPKVSIIVPVFNAAHSLAAALTSLQEQTLGSLEVIVVDDASTDGGIDLLPRSLAKDPRIRFLRVSENSGVHEARLRGLAEASAPWIGFLDADDRARTNMFETMFDIAASKHPDIVACGADRISADGQMIGKKIRFERNELIKDRLFERFCSLEFGTGILWNKLYKAEIIKQHGMRHFRWRQDFNEDMLVNIGCFWTARSIYTLSDSLYEYVSVPKSATNTVTQAQAFARLLRAYALAIESYASLGASARHQIQALYRRQLDFSCYNVDSFPSLDDEDSVAEAIKSLADNCPVALAAIVSRKADSSIVRNTSIKSELLYWKNATKSLFLTTVRALSRSHTRP